MKEVHLACIVFPWWVWLDQLGHTHTPPTPKAPQTLSNIIGLQVFREEAYNFNISRGSTCCTDKILAIKGNLYNCRYFSGLIVGCLQGVDKDTLLSPRYCPVESDYWKEHPMVRDSCRNTALLDLANAAGT